MNSSTSRENGNVLPPRPFRIVGFHISRSGVSPGHFWVSKDLDIPVAFCKLLLDGLGLCHPVNHVAGPFLRIKINRWACS